MNPVDIARQASRILIGRRQSMDLRGRVALVTGAGDGIGFETAKHLHLRGARVAILDRDELAAKQAAEYLGADCALAIACDVTDRDGMAEAVARVVGHFGKLDVVVANAGIAPSAATLRTAGPADVERVLAVNVIGVLNTVRPAIESLIDTGGHVVVVSSCAAFSPPVGGAAYMMSKAAAEQLGRALRIELAPHSVTVTTVYYGVVETAMTRRTLDDDDLGREFERHLPFVLRRRVSAEHAARALVDGIEHRSATIIAPRVWLPVSLARGVLAPVIDRVLVGDPWTHEMIARLESHACDNSTGPNS